jgi:hypothetical protein
MSDIVDRLRSGEDGLEYAAADEIERLLAERDEALSDWRAEMSMHRDEHQRRMRAKAERDRLREALRKIAQQCANTGHGNRIVDSRIVDRCEATALAALKETGHE